MTTPALLFLVLIVIIFVVQFFQYLLEYYEEKNPRYLRVYNYLKKRSGDVDLGYTTLTDVRYELMTKFALTPAEAFNCLEHIYDDNSNWFKQNII